MIVIGDVVESPTSPAGDVIDYLVLYGFGSLFFVVYKFIPGIPVLP